jgi:hypothetical protein
MAPKHKVPKPEYWTDFEDLCKHLWGEVWGDLGIKKNGRSGQEQHGVDVYVRHNYLQAMKSLWPDISKIIFKSFRFKNKTDFYKWNNREGKEYMKTAFPTQSWRQLNLEAKEEEGVVIPERLMRFPELLPLFLIVFPHRADPSALRWIDSHISGLHQNS